MAIVEHSVSQHYEDSQLFARIISGLMESGADLNKLTPEDLAPVDEFHIGGRIATEYAVNKMSLDRDRHVLDIGCGLGGTSRYIASEIGCAVTGIDLTPNYISIANALATLTGLDNKVSYKTANALAMPFADSAFDAATTFHVAMNIDERDTLYSEIFRVLKPGATLCIYDVMKGNNEKLTFPMPWAESNETSHLTTPEEMNTLLENAGFNILEVENRNEFALNFFQEKLAPSSGGPPPLGVHLLMGETAPAKLKNTLLNLEKERIVLIQIIASRR